ncbi:hypothetical protein JH395_16525 (plasmid) [Lactiplantibacillus plantarum]|uniref:Uncharacterized protein n=1 Tax=Lactiplantibacillus plantarum TaxID=1590 RepID=A0A345X0D3_LACPN|nr:hypothetical protein [Lactiplantibacillus plantarum]AUT20100.1 hypothetical protein SH83_15465 [Lactiplantibacillus plantarum]AXJ99935.1 hypothetical protein [Lactiplantibacillus plantarum]QQM62744.1 hypothetical protein JH395_16525 [Lactiplantibacillus plantarum]
MKYFEINADGRYALISASDLSQAVSVLVRKFNQIPCLDYFTEIPEPQV